MAKEKQPISTLRRQPVQPWEAAMKPRHKRRSKPRPWLILSKRNDFLFWRKRPEDRIPKWTVYRRYATEKARQQAWENLLKNKWALRWAEYKLVKE